MPARHPRVPHPRDMLTGRRRLVARVNDYAADHLAMVFGSVWCVWAFIVWPLLGLLLPPRWQTVVFFISSGWIQLWALPLLTHVQNKADQLRTAKADADHVALTHIAVTVDAIRADNATAPKETP